MRARPQTRRPAFFSLTLVGVVAVNLTAASLGFAQSASSLASVSADHSIQQTVERLDMIVKSSRVLSLGDRIPRFQVHNEEVLGATPISENQIQISAKNPGTTQINLWDTTDKLYTIDVTVIADARELEGILASQLPLASLKVTPINESAILSGYVTSVDDVQKAVAIAEQFYTVVINNTEVVGVQQVLLHTKIMEVSRTKLRQLGIDLAFLNSNYSLLNGPGGILNAAAGANIVAPNGNNTNLRLNVNNRFETLMEALHRNELTKLLAEPTVVATHGRPARFTVGGRVPYVVPSGQGQVQVAYEDYGTSIDFLPFVIGPGRIRLEVRPEVSEPDESRGLTIGGASVPAFTTRYVETAVEMQAGQTFALAGLLQSRTESFVRKTPVLGSIPYLGSLFRNVSESRNEIELLIMVTPELVDAMDPFEVPRGGPGLNTDSPDDCELYAHGYIEVPNLKADDCLNEGCGDGIMGGGMIGGGMIGGGMMQQDGYTTPSMQAPPATLHPTTTFNDLDMDLSSRSTNGNGSRQAAGRPRGSGSSAAPPQPSYRTATQTRRGQLESGTLLPPNSVRPGQDPTIVGDGVTVSSPIYR